MKIPHTINPNTFKLYEPSDVAKRLVIDWNRRIKAEDKTWDADHIPRLSELCVLVIVANFEKQVILNQLPCWDRNYLLENLPTDLPLPLVVKHVHDEIYWKRRVADRWKDETNYHKDYGSSWKRMYLEKHVQEAVEAMTPEGFDLASVDELCNLATNYVKNLNLRELQIMKGIVSVDDDDFTIPHVPCEHINLAPIICGLENLKELHVQFGLRNVGDDYKKSSFQFSLQDCRNLGEGVANAKNLRLLRVHSCSLDDDKLNTLLSSMTPNRSLEEVIFSNCTFGDEGAAAVARFMKNRTNLKKVNLCNNKIRANGVSALAFIITQSNVSPVEHLNLKFNPFGDEGFKFLASALVRKKTCLKVLNVSCCGLGETSGILLGEALNRNFILTEVNLSNNHLGEKAGRALEQALRVNRTIQYMDVRMTEISDEDFFSIKEAVFFNRIRCNKGEEGVERELRRRENRLEEEKKTFEEEAAPPKPVEEETQKVETTERL